MDGLQGKMPSETSLRDVQDEVMAKLKRVVSDVVIASDEGEVMVKLKRGYSGSGGG